TAAGEVGPHRTNCCARRARTSIARRVRLTFRAWRDLAAPRSLPEQRKHLVPVGGDESGLIGIRIMEHQVGEAHLDVLPDLLGVLLRVIGNDPACDGALHGPRVGEPFHFDGVPHPDFLLRCPPPPPPPRAVRLRPAPTPRLPPPVTARERPRTWPPPGRDRGRNRSTPSLPSPCRVRRGRARTSQPPPRAPAGAGRCRVPPPYRSW